MESELGEAPEIAEDLSRQQYDALLVLGRLAALTTLQCQLPLKVTAFVPVYAEIVRVTGQLRGISDEKIANLVTTILKNESDKAAVCKFTENVIRLIY
jgi:hypothetical protein